MADSEKITINMSPVDLGKIDLLVEQVGEGAIAVKGIFLNLKNRVEHSLKDQVQQISHMKDKTALFALFSVGGVHGIGSIGAYLNRWILACQTLVVFQHISTPCTPRSLGGCRGIKWRQVAPCAGGTASHSPTPAHPLSPPGDPWPAAYSQLQGPSRGGCRRP